MTNIAPGEATVKNYLSKLMKGKTLASKLLDLKSYDKAEIEALNTVPNRVIECSGTVTFSSLGYPTRVSTQKALGRFVEVMHEKRAEGTFRDFLQGVTQCEFDLLRRVTQAVRANAEQNYGRRLIATSSLLRSLVIVRTLKAIYPDKNRLIFEIGPGSGYVGALLLADGYAYASTDIAQAFYLYQNHLMNRLVPGKVTELAVGGDLSTITTVKPGHALHIPWWKFYAANPSTNLPVDVVTCNHALAEMHPNSLSYVIKFARMMLTKPDSAFVFEGWGNTVNTPIWAVAKRFSDLGFSIAHNNITGSVFVPDDGAVSKGCIKLPIPHRRDPVFNVESYAETGFVQQFHPPVYIAPESTLSKRFTENSELSKSQATIGLDEIYAMLREELGCDDLMTEDEKFSDFTGSPY